MRTVAISLPDNRYGNKKPNEDSFLVKKNVFVVADGITRDPARPIDFGSLSTEELLKNYPSSSPAKKASDLFCQSFIKFSRTNPDPRQAFIFANRKISQLNKKRNPGPDYLVNDFWACVAAGAIIIDGELYWGSIGDCQIAVFSETGKLKFISPDGLKKFNKYISKHPGYWRDPQRRKYIRSQFRNNCHRQDLAGYGALTGERKAEKFIFSGSMKLETGDLLAIFSDGFAKLLLKDNVFKYLKQVFTDKKIFLGYDKKLGKNNYESFGRERTLILAET